LALGAPGALGWLVLCRLLGELKRPGWCRVRYPLGGKVTLGPYCASWEEVRGVDLMW
jgi:hypothetical protein